MMKFDEGRLQGHQSVGGEREKQNGGGEDEIGQFPDVGMFVLGLSLWD